MSACKECGGSGFAESKRDGMVRACVPCPNGCRLRKRMESLPTFDQLLAATMRPVNPVGKAFEVFQ